MRFTKWHGLGNDFVLLDGLDEKVVMTPSLVRQLCDRKRGIGADGVAIILPPEDSRYDLEMRIYNADGTIAEMCGNVTRCVAAYATQKHPYKKQWHILTGAGVMSADVITDTTQAAEVTVMMGIPELQRGDIGITADKEQLAQNIRIDMDGKTLIFTGVSMGNPHVVTFVDDIDAVPLDDWGPRIESNPLFSEKTNVEFAQVLSSNEIRMRVWERGVGITEACGTGSCATLVAAVTNKLVRDTATLILDGGRLQITWSGVGQPVQMTGPAVEVFSGEYKGIGENDDEYTIN